MDEQKPIEQMSMEELQAVANPPQTDYTQMSDSDLQSLANPVSGNEFTRGVHRGIENTKSLVTEGVPALAKSLANRAVHSVVGGADVLDPTINLKAYQAQTEATAKKYPTAYGSLTDITKQEGFADTTKALGGYIASAIGEGVPSIATSMASGGIGAFAAKTAVKSALTRAGVSLTEATAQAAINTAIKQGLGYGALAASVPQNMPETYLNLLAKGQDSPGLAFLVGSLKSGLDAVTPKMQLGKLLGTETASNVLGHSMLKRVGIETGKSFATEGLTESAQEGLDIMAEHLSGVNPDFFSAENMVRLADSGIRGGLAGASTGAGAALIQASPKNLATGGFKAAKEDYVPKAKNDQKYAPEVVSEGTGPTEPPATGAQPTEPVQTQGTQTNATYGQPAIPDVTALHQTPGQYPTHKSTLLTPTWIDPNTIKAAQDANINVESLGKLSQEDLAPIQAQVTATKQAQTQVAKVRKARVAKKTIAEPIVAPTPLEHAPEVKNPARKVEMDMPDVSDLTAGWNVLPDALNTPMNEMRVALSPELYSAFKSQNIVEVERGLSSHYKDDPISELIPSIFNAIKSNPQPFRFSTVKAEGSSHGLFSRTRQTTSTEIMQATKRKIILRETHGTHYEVLMHELVHAATSGLDARVPGMSKIVTELQNLKSLIESYVKLSEKDPNARKNIGWVLRQPKALTSGPLADIHELVAWGLTNPSFNAYLKNLSIREIDTPTGKRVETAFDDLMRLSKLAIAAQTTARLQRQILPSYGNVYDDEIVPTHIAENLAGIELTPEAEKSFAKIIEEAHRIVKELTGSGKLKPFKNLVDTILNEPVRGAQFLHSIYVAFNDSNLNTNETVYHEVWHMLKEAGMFSKQEIAILDSNLSKLKEYADKDNYLHAQDFNTLIQTSEGREEYRANAFGKWAVEYNKNKQQPPPTHQRAFRKVKNFLEKFHNALKGLGFKSFDDIFQSVVEGKRALDSVKDAVYANQTARMQRQADKTADILNNKRDEENADNLDAITEKEKAGIALSKSEKARKEAGKNYGWYTKYIRSTFDMANKDWLGAAIYTALQRKLENASKLLTSYTKLLKDFSSQSKDLRYRVSSLADAMSTYGLKATPTNTGLEFTGLKLDDNGKWVPDTSGKVLKISDMSFTKAYMAQQGVFSQILNDQQDLLKHQVAKSMPEYFKDGDFTMQDLDTALTQAENVKFAAEGTKDYAKADKDLTSLQKLKEQLGNFDQFRMKDYFPNSRFGSFGFTVRDLKGEQVAFYTIEKGYGTDLYNKLQLESTLKELKDKYSDNNKFKVIGDKPITDFTNAHPFTLTYNNMKQHLSQQFITHDLLYSLLYSKGLDEAEYAQLVQDTQQDLLMNRFEKKFSPSKHLPGYSKDYDRVMHAYMTGGSHFISAMESMQEISALKSEVAKSSDDVLVAKYTKFIDYMSRPQEDLQAIRTLNFMWTMGGNLSTAALQVMTLPTMTLGHMSLYSPNIVKNMMLISKYFYRAMMSLVTGNLDLSQGAITFEKVNSSFKDLKQIAFNQYAYKIGKIGGLAVEQTGYAKTYETDTMIGKVKEKRDALAHLLGKPISVMEQVTRYATLNSMYELMETNPEARARAQRLLKDNPLFQAQMAAHPDLGFAGTVALMNMDSVHGVFGKLGRPEIYKGLGGAVFMPFQVYPHYAIESMIRMTGQGKDGYRALAVTLGALLMLGGAVALPGMELLKEMLEAILKNTTGHEDDLNLLMQEAIYKGTGSHFLADTAVGGLTRSVMGLDISKRIGVNIPGQQQVLALTGVQGDATAMAGVQGSILSNTINAWNQYNAGSSGLEVGAALLPVGVANVLSAVAMGSQGVSTRSGIQVLTPEQVTLQTQVLKAFGVRSADIAQATEAAYYTSLIKNADKVGLDNFRKQVVNIKTDIARARADNDMDKVQELQEDLQDRMRALHKFVKDNQLRAFPYNAFNKNTNLKARDNNTEATIYKGIPKNAKQDIREMHEATGTK